MGLKTEILKILAHFWLQNKMLILMTNVDFTINWSLYPIVHYRFIDGEILMVLMKSKNNNAKWVIIYVIQLGITDWAYNVKPFVYLFICPSVSLSVCLPVCLCLCLSVFHSPCVSFYQSICQSVCLSLCLFLSLSVYCAL